MIHLSKPIENIMQRVIPKLPKLWALVNDNLFLMAHSS